MQKRLFHQMALTIQVLVIVTLFLAVLARRNLGLHPLAFRLLDEGVTVVALIRDQVFGGEALDERASLCALCAGSLRSNDSERHTMRIHGQMYLGVEPPLVRLLP